MIEPCQHPEHQWVWRPELPTHFEPNEAAYLLFREAAPPKFRRAIEAQIAHGVTAEELTRALVQESTLPHAAIQVIGAALAFWVQRAQEDL